MHTCEGFLSRGDERFLSGKSAAKLYERDVADALGIDPADRDEPFR